VADLHFGLLSPPPGSTYPTHNRKSDVSRFQFIPKYIKGCVKQPACKGVKWI